MLIKRLYLLAIKIHGNILKFKTGKMMEYQNHRAGSETKVESNLSLTQSRIINCVIRSNLADRGSLYMGELKGQSVIDQLRQLNVRSILSCSQGNKLHYNPIDIPNYKYQPFPQDSIFTLNEYFRSVSSFINQSLSKSNCLIHFQNSIDTPISIVIAYLMRYQNLNIEQSLDFIKNKIKNVNLSPKLQSALKQFEQHLNKNQSLNNKNEKIFNRSQLSSKKSTNSKKISYSLDSKHDLNPQNVDDISFQKIQTPRRYKTSKTYIPQKQFQVSTKIKTENPSNIQLDESLSKSQIPTHKKALHFDQIFSQNHIEYVAIKREPKTKKQKNTQKHSKQKTKKTQNLEKQDSFCKTMNPQVHEISKSRVSKISKTSDLIKSKSIQKNYSEQFDISQIVGRQFKLSPSKREHFQKVNQELNKCFEEITTTYETEITTSRLNYLNRLRQLRPIKKQTQQSQKASQQIIKI